MQVSFFLITSALMSIRLSIAADMNRFDSRKLKEVADFTSYALHFHGYRNDLFKVEEMGLCSVLQAKNQTELMFVANFDRCANPTWWPRLLRPEEIELEPILAAKSSTDGLISSSSTAKKRNSTEIISYLVVGVALLDNHPYSIDMMHALFSGKYFTCTLTRLHFVL